MRVDDEGAPLDVALVPLRTAVDDYQSDGECLLYNESRDEASALNRTATEIWQLCDGSRSIETIAGVLGQRYGVDAAILLDDLSRALLLLRAQGLVELHAGRAGRVAWSA